MHSRMTGIAIGLEFQEGISNVINNIIETIEDKSEAEEVIKYFLATLISPMVSEEERFNEVSTIAKTISAYSSLLEESIAEYEESLEVPKCKCC